jgi:hypothetical protein
LGRTRNPNVMTTAEIYRKGVAQSLAQAQADLNAI